MKHVTKLLACASLIATLTACSKDGVDPNPGEKTPVTFKADIATRAHDGAWDAGDVVGLTMLDATRSRILDNVYNYAYYTPTTGGDFLPSVSSKTIYFPQDGSQVAFQGYYPYLPTLGADLKIPFSVVSQASLPQIDLMTTDHIRGFSKNDLLVDLHFKHRLSQVVFNLTIEDGQTAFPLEGVTLTIKGMNTTGTYDLMTDTPTYNNSVADITVPYRTVASERRGIVLPRAAGTGVTFLFTTADGREYTALMDPNLVLDPGYRYTFNVTLQRTPVTVSADITDWIDAPGVGPVNAVTVGTQVSGGNVPNGTEMTVFTGNPTTRTKLADFTFNGTTWSTTPVVYWDNITSPTNFYAEILDPTHGLGIVSPDASQPDARLVATPVPATASNGVSLDLKYPVALGVFNLFSSDGSFTNAELAAMTLTLPQYEAGGTYNNGIFTPGGTPTDVNVPVAATATPGVYGGRAILEPQNINSGGTIAQITTPAPNGRTYEAKYTTTVNFKAGMITEVTIDMKKTDVTISANYTDWVPGQQISLTPVAINIGGTYEGTNTFFNNQDIHVYRLGSTISEYVYSYSPSPTSSGWTGTPTLYWDDMQTNTGNPLRLTSLYFPYQPNTITLNPNQSVYNRTLPIDQSGGYKNEDLLSSHLPDITSPEYVNFEFTHMFSQVRVVLTSPSGQFLPSELQGATVRLNGFVVDGSFSLATGAATGSNTQVTGLIPLTETDGSTYSALVMPSTIASGYGAVTVTLPDYPNTPFTGNLNASLTMVAGKTSLITVTLQKTLIQLSATLEDWGTGPSGTIVIQ